MRKNIVGIVGLSGLLFLGAAPRVVLAHEGDDHGAHHQKRPSEYSEPEDDYYRRSEPRYGEERSRYEGEREESRRHAPPRGDEQEDEGHDDDYDDE